MLRPVSCTRFNVANLFVNKTPFQNNHNTNQNSIDFKAQQRQIIFLHALFITLLPILSDSSDRPFAMPFIGRQAPDTLRKRRRHDVDDSGTFFDIYPASDDPLDLISPTRRVLPLSKRSKLGVMAASADFTPCHRRRTSSQQQHQQQKQGPVILSPCHVCHRRPTKKTDLDSYADCQGCGQRTCFICIRECHGGSNEQEQDAAVASQMSRSFCMEDADADDESSGWDARGHQAVVCSRCCVERGAEGEVICLGCLSGTTPA